MKPITVNKLIEVVCAEVLPPEVSTRPAKQTITSVTTDSRAAGPGSCFFAIKGERIDGHDFVVSALQKGASCTVVQEQRDWSRQTGGSVLYVKDVIKALGKLAGWYRRGLGAKVIAVTGSAGKTTTKQIIYECIRTRYRSTAAPKSFNNHIGVPVTILSADADTEIIVAELGSNHPGEIEYLAKIAQPDIVVITNIYPAHLEGFGSIDGIIKEKSSISTGLRDGASLFVNGDFEALTSYCCRQGLSFRTFGTTDSCQIRGTDLQSTGTSGQLTIEGIKIEVALAGRANLENVIAAWAVCREFGFTVQDFAREITRLKPVDMRMVIEKFGTITLINDCYNANPASMENALDCLSQLRQDNPTGRMVFICGSMNELGDQSRQLHRQLAQKAARCGVDVLLATGAFGPAVAQTFRQQCPGAVCEVFENSQTLADNLQGFLCPDDIILVKGSRAAELEKVSERIKTLFNR